MMNPQSNKVNQSVDQRQNCYVNFLIMILPVVYSNFFIEYNMRDDDIEMLYD